MGRENSFFTYTKMLFPPSEKDCVHLSQIATKLVKKGFIENSKTRRSKVFSKDIQTHLTKCSCAEAKQFSNPADYCRHKTDLYASPDGKIKPCRYDQREIDILEVTGERDINGLIPKIAEAIKLITNKTCLDYLKCL